MDTDKKPGCVEELKHADLTYDIIGAAFEVHGKLGSGFLEKVYENAMMIALRRRGLKAQQQHPVEVVFEGEVVGNYFADIIVEGNIIVELKAGESIADAHRSQIVNYLKASGLPVGLILNFGAKLTHARYVN